MGGHGPGFFSVKDKRSPVYSSTRLRLEAGLPLFKRGPLTEALNPAVGLAGAERKISNKSLQAKSSVKLAFASGVLLLADLKHNVNFKLNAAKPVSRKWSLLYKQPSESEATRIAAYSTRFPDKVRNIWGMSYNVFARHFYDSLLGMFLKGHYPLFFSENEQLWKRGKALLSKGLNKFHLLRAKT